MNNLGNNSLEQFKINQINQIRNHIRDAYTRIYQNIERYEDTNDDTDNVIMTTNDNSEENDENSESKEERPFRYSDNVFNNTTFR